MYPGNIKMKTNFHKYIFRYCYLKTLSISLDHMLMFLKEKKQWKEKGDAWEHQLLYPQYSHHRPQAWAPSPSCPPPVSGSPS